MSIRPTHDNHKQLQKLSECRCSNILSKPDRNLIRCRKWDRNPFHESGRNPFHQEFQPRSAFHRARKSDPRKTTSICTKPPLWFGAKLLSRGCMGPFWAILESAQRFLGYFLGRLGACLGSVGCIVGPSGTFLGPSWGIYGPSMDKKEIKLAPEHTSDKPYPSASLLLHALAHSHTSCRVFPVLGPPPQTPTYPRRVGLTVKVWHVMVACSAVRGV